MLRRRQSRDVRRYFELFGNYTAPQPEVFPPRPDATGRDARTGFRAFVASREERLEQLTALLSRHAVDLDGSDESVRSLERWLDASMREELAKDGSVDPTWYSVGWDVGVFLGELMITRRPELTWALCTWGGKSYIHYRWPVITGFHTSWRMDLAPTQRTLRFVDRRTSVRTVEGAVADLVKAIEQAAPTGQLSAECLDRLTQAPETRRDEAGEEFLELLRNAKSTEGQERT